MSYSIAGIDVHKKMLAVVIADVAVEGEYCYERRKFGATAGEMRLLAEWLIQHEVLEVVMESTAQYWRPVWAELEQQWRPVMRRREGAGPMAGKLHLAQAKSNRGRPGRKNDYRDAERLVRRLVAQELVLSFVPEPEQRLWRTLTRRKQQLMQDRVRFQNRLEALLEQMHIKLSGHMTDLLGVSGRRMLKALAEGATDPAAVAALADPGLRATPEQLRDALAACVDLPPVYRQLLKMELEELKFLEEQMDKLERETAELLKGHAAAVERLAEVPGLGVESAQQIIAETGPTAAAFPSAGDLASWVGVCPGDNVTADKKHSTRSPKGNRHMRRLLDQAAHAAVKMKGSIFEVTFHRLLPRMDYKEAIWCIAHRLCRLIWKILHQGVRYEERGPAVSDKAKRKRVAKMVRELIKAGYRVEVPTLQQAEPALAQPV
jgi:transposase